MPWHFRLSHCSLWNCALLILGHKLIRTCLLSVRPDGGWCRLSELCRFWTDPPEAAVVCHRNLSPPQPLAHVGELSAGKRSWQGMIFWVSSKRFSCGKCHGLPTVKFSCAVAASFLEFWIFLSLLLGNKWSVLLVPWGKAKQGSLNCLLGNIMHWNALERFLCPVSFYDLVEGPDTCTW